MAWRTMAVRDQRVQFVVRAQQGQEKLSRLCVEFGISRPTAYLWLKRYRDQGVAGIEERSRRPAHSPRQTAPSIAQRIAELRRQRPDWGARKLQLLLHDEGVDLPVITVHRVLLRLGLVRPDDRRVPAWQRFEREAPNQLWQMDFKSPKGCQSPVGPLSVIDDHSRYLIALEKTGTTRSQAVQERLEHAFTTCGLPEAMLMDHGTPWWNAQAPSGWTQLQVWLMKHGIVCIFSGIRHPQTQGKVERFHLALEMARRRRLPQTEMDQVWLDQFRHEYNYIRPHEALGMRTPSTRWSPSPRRYHPHPPEWSYPEGAELQRLGSRGQLHFDGRRWDISQALAREQVQLVRIADRILVYYCNSLLKELDVTAQRSTTLAPWTQPNCKGCPDNAV
jgi:transposase InsO family protein